MCKMKRKVAFTITELAVAFILLTIVSLIVSIEAISQVRKKLVVEKVQEIYEMLDKATLAWQAEDDCIEDVRACIQASRDYGVDADIIFNDIAKYLPVVASTVDIEAKGRYVKGEELADVEWLPLMTKNSRGEYQKDSRIGVSKYLDKNRLGTSYYLLNDGVTIAVNFDNVVSPTGFGFFDIDGKAGSNQIGKDVFPFSIGANPIGKGLSYKELKSGINPYFATDMNVEENELCNINKLVCDDSEGKKNPTIYVLENKKLP